MCSCSDTDIDPFIVIGVVIMLKKKTQLCDHWIICCKWTWMGYTGVFHV